MACCADSGGTAPSPNRAAARPSSVSRSGPLASPFEQDIGAAPRPAARAGLSVSSAPLPVVLDADVVEVEVAAPVEESAEEEVALQRLGVLGQVGQRLARRRQRLLQVADDAVDRPLVAAEIGDRVLRVLRWPRADWRPPAPPRRRSPSPSRRPRRRSRTCRGCRVPGGRPATISCRSAATFCREAVIARISVPMSVDERLGVGGGRRHRRQRGRRRRP